MSERETTLLKIPCKYLTITTNTDIFLWNYFKCILLFHRNKQRFREILNLHVVPQRITTNKIKSDSVHKVRVSCVQNIYIHGISLKLFHNKKKNILSYGLYARAVWYLVYAIYSIMLMLFHVYQQIYYKLTIVLHYLNFKT